MLKKIFIIFACLTFLVSTCGCISAHTDSDVVVSDVGLGGSLGEECNFEKFGSISDDGYVLNHYMDSEDCSYGTFETNSNGDGDTISKYCDLYPDGTLLVSGDFGIILENSSVKRPHGKVLDVMGLEFYGVVGEDYINEISGKGTFIKTIKAIDENNIYGTYYIFSIGGTYKAISKSIFPNHLLHIIND